VTEQQQSINDSPRGSRSYIWPTWVTGLLAGSDKCVWKAWYKAHFRYAKREGDGNFNLKEWTKQHNEMTDSRVQRLKDEGWPMVTIEDQNSFKLEGQRGTLSGKPDIVAIDPTEARALVIDEKSGRERESDVWQIMVYMFALPMTLFKKLFGDQEYQLDGEVEYRGSQRAVPASMFNLRARQHITSMLRIVGGDEEPVRTPSANECRYCDILACPDRFEGSDVSSADASDFF
jgi:hypothetical protein